MGPSFCGTHLPVIGSKKSGRGPGHRKQAGVILGANWVRTVGFPWALGFWNMGVSRNWGGGGFFVR